MNGLRSLGLAMSCVTLMAATAVAQSDGPVSQTSKRQRVAGEGPQSRFNSDDQLPPFHRPEEVVFQTLDSNGDDEVSSTELAAAPEKLRAFDRNSDGVLTREEMRPHQPQRDRPHRNQPRRDTSHNLPVETGFVFINGVYLPPPYVVTTVDGAVMVNNQVLHQPSVRQPHGRNWGPREFSDGAREIVSKLQQDLIIVAFPKQPMVVLEQGGSFSDFSDFLITNQDRDLAFQGLSELLSSQEQQDTWSQWPATFEPSSELAARLKIKVDRVNAIVADAREKSSGVRRLEAVSYPLSILGMVLAVLAIGHVLTFRPTIDITDTNHAQVIWATLQSVALIVGLSGLDLAWTLLASQAGIMQELNPLGAKLIEKPIFLIAFKAAATLVAAGLLAALRNYRRAQLASWWLCLVCALVTCRWLVFNSMFVS